MSFDRLIKNIIDKNNPTVAGLDPNLDYVPEFIRKESFSKYGETLEGAADALLTFNKAIIDEIYDLVPAIKPQAAYYEMYGWQGVKALAETIKYAQSKGLGETRVGSNTFEAFGADALTVNGYLGTDGIAPLLEICEKKDKGIFVLVKTSNKSSGELQDQKIGDNAVYAVMGDMCEKWGSEQIGKYGYSSVGAVVGATYPEQLTELRARLPHTFFLVPGYGAQGGGAEGLKGAFDAKGIGAIVNSSRAIMCAYTKEGCDEKDFAKASRREVLRMRDDITSVIGK